MPRQHRFTFDDRSKEPVSRLLVQKRMTPEQAALNDLVARLKAHQESTQVKTLVLAGSYAQYENHLRQNGLNRHTHTCLMRPEQLLGFVNPVVVRVGTWYDLPSLVAIEEVLESRMRPEHRESPARPS